MTGSLKRAMLGRCSRAEKQTAGALAALGFLLSQALDPSLTSLPMLLMALAFGWKLVAAFSLLVSIPYFGLGYGPGIVGLASAALVEGFREVYRRESQVAKDRQDLLKTLVHELRNPLFAAKGTIDNLSSRLPNLDSRDLELQLAMASSAMQSINQEVDHLTQLLRLESGRLVASFERVKLEEIFHQLRLRFPAQSLPNHSLEFFGGEIELVCDSLLLLQALDKLVGNAIVHSTGGLVSVSAQDNEPGYEIEVRDQGPGIPADQQKAVFERYKQLGPNSIGFGLGLFLARQYVLAQNGELTLEESECGCRFRIWLP